MTRAFRGLAQRRAVFRPWILAGFSASLVLTVLFVLASARPADAATHIGTTVYSNNTTWTLANSPYVLDGNVTVLPAATLTIEAGVVVKFNGQFRTLNVDGTLNATGTASNRIVFTSYQDDSAAGDTNGDGNATSGAPGQWYHMSIRNAGSQLAYADIRYGGWGSGQGYAPVYVYGNGYSVTIDHATISNNHQAAVVVGNRASATIKNSTLSDNVYGLYVNAGTATVDQTTVSNNSSRGVWFNLPTLNPAPAVSAITGSDITQNGGYGVYVVANHGYPLASMPTGTGSNIHGNNANGAQLFTPGSFKRADVNWRGNYWGSDVYYWYGSGGCAGTAPNSPGHLAYRSSGGNVPAGPISHGSYLAGTSWCGYDSFKVDECDFYIAEIDGSPQVPWCQTFGSEHGNDPSEELADPVNSATGGFEHAETDLSLPGKGFPFTFTRSYASLDLARGVLGQGWTHNFAASLSVKANGDVTVRGGDGQQVAYVKQPDGTFDGAPGALSTLVGVAGAYELTRKDQVKYTFDSQGTLTGIVERNGEGLTLAYGVDGKLATVTDAAGRTITFTHNAAGLLTNVAIPSVGAVSYGYTDGRLTSFTDLNSRVWSYTYESHGFLATHVDPLGHKHFENSYGNDGRVTQQLDALGQATTFSWNPATQTTTATDPRGNTWKDVYDGNVLQERIDGEGNVTEFAHDSNLNGSSIESPTGAATAMTHDARGNLLTLTAPASLGSVTKTLVYNARNDLTSATDGRGKVTTYGYDAEGNQTSITEDGHTVAQFAYNTAGQVTSSTDGNGKTTTYTYDTSGNRTSVTDPLGNKTTYTYDAAGRVLTRVDPRGNVTGANPADHRTTYIYDAGGSLLTETNPLGHVTTYTYDAAGNRTSVTDALSRTTTYTYDAADRLVATTAPDPDGAGPLTAPVTTYTYDVAGNRLTQVEPRGNAPGGNPAAYTTTYTYDDNNRLLSVTSPDGAKRSYTYDANGNRATTVEPRGHVQGANPADYTTSYTYDAAGRPLTETDPLGNATTYTYDATGNRTSARDANNHTTTTTYDAAGRPLTIAAPDGGVTSYTYDGNGRPVARTDPNTHTTSFGYDDAGQLTSLIGPDPDGAGPLSAPVTTYAYDANGKLISKVDPNGNGTATPGDGTTTYTYDAANRLTAVAFSDATPDVSLTYDAAGNRTGMTDGFGSVAYAYDGLNRLMGATRGTDTFSYSYDLAGNVTGRTYPDGTVVAYTYDVDNRLASATTGGNATTYAYDAMGHLTQTTLPAANGYVETRTYDRAGRTTGVKHARSGTVLTDLAYTLDPVGNPTAVLRTGSVTGTTTYEYDSNDRLTGVCFQPSCPAFNDPFIRWTYDQAGNRLTETRPPGTTTYTYDAGDRLTSTGSTTYAYDANGNQTGAGARSFTYDLANRLSVTTQGSTTTTYAYDGDGNRLEASTGSQPSEKTRYLWDLNRPLAQVALERDGNDALRRRHVYGADRISVTAGGSSHYYAHDRMGSVTNLTSASGVTEWTYDYEPFGGIRTETQNDPQAPANPFKFAGELSDPTGSYYLRARQYDPAAGRFNRPDPVFASGIDTAISSYSYAAGRPTVLVDPTGMTFEPIDDGEELADEATSPEDDLGWHPGLPEEFGSSMRVARMHEEWPPEAATPVAPGPGAGPSAPGGGDSAPGGGSDDGPHRRPPPIGFYDILFQRPHFSTREYWRGRHMFLVKAQWVHLRGAYPRWFTLKLRLQWKPHHGGWLNTGAERKEVNIPERRVMWAGARCNPGTVRTLRGRGRGDAHWMMDFNEVRHSLPRHNVKCGPP